MVTDEQVRLLRRKQMEGKSQEAAAAEAGMSVRTARKWWSVGALPSASKVSRSGATRTADPISRPPRRSANRLGRRPSSDVGLP